MKKFLVELFSKSSWGYGGETPVTPYKNIKINKGISPCLGLSHVSAHLHTLVQMGSTYRPSLRRRRTATRFSKYQI